MELLTQGWNNIRDALADDRELGEKLHKIECEYLSSPLSNDSRRKPELVSHITEKLIMPNLREHFSGVAYTGSSNELTTVPGQSDFDIQLYLKLPNTRSYWQTIYSATAEPLREPAWMLVKGGPEHLRNPEGNLSTEKARRFTKSKVDQSLQRKSAPLFYGEDVRITCSTNGPATTLNVRWKGETLSIDIVTCLQASDVGDENGYSCRFDLVAKSYNGSHRDADGVWRITYSRQEVDALRNCLERQRVLLRIMKVVKNYQPQLNQFPSYFYKNVLFKMVEESPWSNWEGNEFPRRFKDMIKTMRNCLRDEELPLHFNRNVNYLKDAKNLSSIATYLTDIINRGSYADLLARVPTRQSGMDTLVQGLRNLFVHDAGPQQAEGLGNESCNVM